MSKANKFVGFASDIKVIVDAIQTPFVAAVVVLLFLGVALSNLSFGLGNLVSEIRGGIIYLLICVMVALVVVVLPLLCMVQAHKDSVVRHIKPRDIKQDIKFK